MIEIKFTLCFIRHNQKYLMLFRNHPPNQFRWNGVGGKIEGNEPPIFACQREIEEETGLHLPTSAIEYKGIVTWNQMGGMYVFIAESESDHVVSGDEGRLEWKTLDWIYHSGEAVSNISQFLPYMLKDSELAEHAFTYNEAEEVIDYVIKPLHSEYVVGRV